MIDERVLFFKLFIRYHVEPDSLHGPSGGGCMTYSIRKVSLFPNP